MKKRGAPKARGARQRRAGATETFSVSVDAETKRALRALADDEFGGNMSALITELAAEARRRLAARAVLRRFGMKPFTKDEAEAFQALTLREATAWHTRRKRKAA
jgi:hypothetical protein